jgi:hypothetical protein
MGPVLQGYRGVAASTAGESTLAWARFVSSDCGVTGAGDQVGQRVWLARDGAGLALAGSGGGDGVAHAVLEVIGYGAVRRVLVELQNMT